MTLPGATRIFVYGTLLPGGSNHGLLANAAFERAVRTAPGFALADLGPYPGLLREGDGTVTGEVWAVDAQALATLDRLEDVPRLYVREPVELEDGARVDAYLYARDAAGAPRIHGGAWLGRA